MGTVHKPQLIATDVDGTLLGPDELLTSRTRGALAGAVRDGVPVVLVSGRPPRWLAPVARRAGLTGYAVCSNGAVLYDVGADEVLELHGLEPEHLRTVAKTLTTALPDAKLGAERVGTSALDGDVRRFVSEPGYYNPWGDSEELIVSRADVVADPAVKLLVSDPRMSSDAMAAAALAALDGSVDVTFSTGGGLIELARPGVTKATGIADIAARLGVAADSTIAFGDMPNDVAMLRWAGHSVAVANAHPAVHEAADETTAPNSEDGVAQVLERWF